MAEALYHDPALAALYDDLNGWDADFAWVDAQVRPGDRVLDLGCGTGELAAHLAARADVTGVDQAEAMLAAARARPGGDGVLWVAADARTLDLDRRFDWIVLTGHAFQCFLTDADQDAVCAAIARHLARGGRFAFDSRNPEDRAWERWAEAVHTRPFRTASGDASVATASAWDGATEIVSYRQTYRTADGTRTSTARIRFAPRTRIAAALAGAGLTVHTWLGDWSGAPLTSGSPDIIPVGGLTR
ncbi:class I SAM-dependent methyltransferase [Rhodobacteraceae bacterium CCMM004]|nr:class I SAM-dependent methyltransferase [Rhodobacteraceae bacterium CCMM004]